MKNTKVFLIKLDGIYMRLYTFVFGGAVIYIGGRRQQAMNPLRTWSL